MGFTQHEIDVHKRIFLQCNKHALRRAKVAKDTQSRLPVATNEATQLQLRPRIEPRVEPRVEPPNRPRTAENASSRVIANAGLASLDRNTASSRQFVVVRLRKNHCAGCGLTTLSVQPVASFNIESPSRRMHPSAVPNSSLHHSAAYARQLLAAREFTRRHNIPTTGPSRLPPRVYSSSASAPSRTSTALAPSATLSVSNDCLLNP